MPKHAPTTPQPTAGIAHGLTVTLPGGHRCAVYTATDDAAETTRDMVRHNGCQAALFAYTAMTEGHLFPMSTYDRIRAAEVKVGDLLLGLYFGVAAVVVDVQDGINGATRITYTAEAGRISPHPAAATRDYPADAMVERMTP